MKTKILASALSCALLGNASAEINDVKSEKKYSSGFHYDPTRAHEYKPNSYKLKRSERVREDVIRRSKMNSIELFAFDPKTFLNADNFVYFDSLPEEIKDTYTVAKLNNENVKPTKFEHTMLLPKFTGEILEKKELKIKKLLSDCLERLPQPQEIDIKVNGYPNLYWPTYQCTQYLYSDRYDIEDFSYNESNLDKLEVEKIYTSIYLHIKEAGLLSKIFYTYYPKLLLREHANQTGLTAFIDTKEANAKQRFRHNELAAEFFGSHEAWMKSFYEFLDEKIIKLKIGE